MYYFTFIQNCNLEIKIQILNNHFLTLQPSIESYPYPILEALLILFWLCKCRSLTCQIVTEIKITSSWTVSRLHWGAMISGATEQFYNIHHFNNNHSLPSSEKSHIPEVVAAVASWSFQPIAVRSNSYWDWLTVQGIQRTCHHWSSKDIKTVMLRLLVLSGLWGVNVNHSIISWFCCCRLQPRPAAAILPLHYHHTV